MTSELRHRLEEARPSLRLVSPLTYWIIFILGILNIILGLAFAFALEAGSLDSTLRSVSLVVPIWAWAILFTFLGLAKLYALTSNDWRLARYSLLGGVMLKSGWAVALVFRSLEVPSNIFLTATWITISVIQIIAYIHFLPPTEMRFTNRRKGRGF